MTEKVLAFFKDHCPLFQDQSLAVNQVTGTDVVSLVPEHAPPTVTRYTDGGEVRQFVFSLVFRTYYAGEPKHQVAAMNRLEQLADWMEDITRKNAWKGEICSLCPVALEQVSTGYMEHATPKTTRYKVKCRLLYEKKGEFESWVL